MTKDEWKTRYIKRMIDLGIDEPFAIEAGSIGVEVEEEHEGSNVADWSLPEHAADEEMSCWGD